MTPHLANADTSSRVDPVREGEVRSAQSQQCGDGTQPILPPASEPSAAFTPGPWRLDGTIVWTTRSTRTIVPACCGFPRPSGECCGNAVTEERWDHEQVQICNADTFESARLIAAAPEMATDGMFLLARLDEFEMALEGGEVERQFYGHVAPALARFRAVVKAALGPSEHDTSGANDPPREDR